MHMKTLSCMQLHHGTTVHSIDDIFIMEGLLRRRTYGSDLLSVRSAWLLCYTIVIYVMVTCTAGGKLVTSAGGWFMNDHSWSGLVRCMGMSIQAAMMGSHNLLSNN